MNSQILTTRLLTAKINTISVPAYLRSNCFFLFLFFAADEGASRPASPLSHPHQPLNGSVWVLPSLGALPTMELLGQGRSPPRRHLALKK